MRRVVTFLSACLFVVSMAALALAGEAGTLVVIAQPESQVFVDGEELGSTPISVQLEPGDHQIELKLADGRQRRMTKSVSAGKQTKIFLRW